MGGRGTFASGNNVAFTYETVGKIDGVKVLQPINGRASLKIPEESHTANTTYVLYDRDGVFHQLREYRDHKVVLEIGYHNEPPLGKGKVLHVHYHTTPGVENHQIATKMLLTKNDALYKKFFKGVE